MRPIAAGLALLLLAAAPLHAAPAPDHLVVPLPALRRADARLAPQHATYALTLEQSRGSSVVASSGEMTYDVTDACNAWATRQRLAMVLTNRDGQDVRMVSDYATWESKDGTRMRFHMRQTTDGAVTQQVDGEASLQSVGGPGEVHYTAPKNETMALPAGTLFPMMHTAAIITAAEEGRKFFAVPLFDGTGPDGAQNTFVIIPSWTDKPQPTRFPTLAHQPSGRVRIGFFTRTRQTQVPDYEVGMRYWQDGVADDLDMDFGDFVMKGRLEKLTIPAPHC